MAQERDDRGASAAGGLPAVAAVGLTAGADAMRSAGFAWLGLQRRSIEQTMETLEALWRCRTLQDLLAIQARHAANLMAESVSRGADVAATALEGAGRTVAAGARAAPPVAPGAGRSRGRPGAQTQ